MNGNALHTSGKVHIFRATTLTRPFITGGAVVVAAVHLIWPSLKLDGITLALLVIALLPWLGTVFESLELPGGWKVQYREIKQQLNEAQAKTQQATGAAASASHKAELALATSGSGEQVGTAAQLNDMADEYNRVRASQPSSYPRTTILTQVVGRMVALSRKLADYDWQNSLRSDNQGQRMTGYAWLYARPDPAAAELLVHTLTKREDSHFGQYWAIQALQQSLPLADPNTVATLTAELRVFLSKVPPDSDRYYELSDLLNLSAEPPQ